MEQTQNVKKAGNYEAEFSLWPFWPLTSTAMAAAGGRSWAGPGLSR